MHFHFGFSINTVLQHSKITWTIQKKKEQQVSTITMNDGSSNNGKDITVVAWK